jgi:CPA2 family monovalent cation:H+ antiporter-2
MEIVWRSLPAGSPLVGQSLAETDLRARTNASVIALVRDGQALTNPKSSTQFAAGDMIGLIGNPRQLARVDAALASAADAGGVPGSLRQPGVAAGEPAA